jgi:hypothetical protein
MSSRRPIARCGAACRSLLPGPGWPLSAGQVRNEVPALKFETGTGTFRGHPARTSPAGICSPSRS